MKYCNYIFYLLLFYNLYNDSNNCFENCSQVKTVFIPISQGQNLYTQYHKPINLTKDNCWMTDLSITYRFMQTTNSNNIVKFLFEYNPITFIGSSNGTDINRPDNALIPEYFGMGSYTNTNLCLFPKIHNNIIDFQLALNGEKAWFQINVPFTRSNWLINSGKCINNEIGQNPFDIGKDPSETTESSAGNVMITGPNTGLTYTLTTDNIDNLGIDGDNTNYLNQYIEEQIGFVNGDAFISEQSTEGDYSIGLGNYITPNYSNEVLGDFVNITLNNIPQIVCTTDTILNIDQNLVLPAPTMNSALGGYTFGNLQNRYYNLFNFGSSRCTSIWGIADIIVQLGWDFCKEDCKHFGLYIRSVIPTGTNLNSFWAQYVFSPIIGNGRHFELGAGLSAHYNIWECNNSNLAFIIDGYLTHPFSASSYRSFDLDNSPMTRYSVVKPLNDDLTTKGTLAVLGDINSGCMNTYINLRSEFICKLLYSCSNWNVGSGYAFSGLSKETMPCCESPVNFYGLKGSTAITNFQMSWPVGINNNPITTLKNPEVLNNVTFSAFLDSHVATNGSAYKYGSFENTANISNSFILPSYNSSGLMGAQILNRIFFNIDYIWDDCYWKPTFGILGSYGFNPSSYLTAKYWDIGCIIRFVF